MDRGQRGIIIRFWLITVSCLVLFVSWMVCLYAKNEATYIVMQNIMVFSYAVLGVVLVVLFHEDYWMVTSGFLLVCAILEIGKLYFYLGMCDFLYSDTHDRFHSSAFAGDGFLYGMGELLAYTCQNRCCIEK